MNEINIVHEINIKNKNNKSKNIKIMNEYKLNYDLQNNFFDPNAGSPPNYFISKLLTRIKNYEHCKKL